MSLTAVPQAQYAPYLDQEQMQAIASSLNVGNLDAPNVTQPLLSSTFPQS